MKFTLIGSGFILPRHAESINFVGGKIVDIINTAHGGNTWKEAVKNPDVDCIVILTPNDLHFPIALEALQNNRIVLCEKPLVLNSQDATILSQYKNIFTTLQLRYHPLVKKLKEEISRAKKNEIEMDISVYRDEKYYQSWKGQKERSGGVLFNLGIHYFDLLLYLFGQSRKLQTDFLDDHAGTGVIEGDNFICRWKVSTGERRDNQKRVFKINGVDYNFSSQDNLSYENLHRYVYQDLVKKSGITPEEAGVSIKLVEDLYSSYK